MQGSFDDSSILAVILWQQFLVNYFKSQPFLLGIVGQNILNSRLVNFKYSLKTFKYNVHKIHVNKLYKNQNSDKGELCMSCKEIMQSFINIKKSQFFINIKNLKTSKIYQSMMATIKWLTKMVTKVPMYHDEYFTPATTNAK